MQLSTGKTTGMKPNKVSRREMGSAAPSGDAAKLVREHPSMLFEKE